MLYRVLSVLLGVSWLLAASVTAASAIDVSQIDDVQTYEIKSVDESDKCIDIPGASQESRAVAQIYGCHGGSNQRFTFRNNGSNRFEIVAKHSGKCLDVESSGQSGWRNVQQFTCHGGDNQLWEVVPDGLSVEFIVEHSRKCMYAKENWPWQDDLVQRDCDNGDRQKWLMNLVAEIGNGICESSEGEGCWNEPACGLCPPPGLRVSVFGQTELDPNEAGFFGASVSGGVPPYTLSWSKATSSTVTSLPGGSTTSASDTESFSVICDVTDAAGNFATAFLFVDVDGVGGPIVY